MGLLIKGIFEDCYMPLSGFIDLRLHFEDGKLTTTMPRTIKPYYCEYETEFVNTINQKNEGENE